MSDDFQQRGGSPWGTPQAVEVEVEMDLEEDQHLRMLIKL